MNKGYQNLKQLEEATIAAVNNLEHMIITEGNTASHQLGEEVKARREACAMEAELRAQGLTENANDIATIGDRFYDFRSRGFWSRLNWLVTGR